MAFSCYFDFEAKEKREEKVWNVTTNEGVEWCIKEKWITQEDISPIWERHLNESEEVCWHQISLQSTNGSKYFAELEFIDQENPHLSKRLLTKQQVFSSSSVIDVSLGEYVRHFSIPGYAHPIFLRCVINLFPLFHQMPVDPLPLNPCDTSELPVKLKKAAEKLEFDMKPFVETASLTDVLLICDSSVIRAHKCTLSARSPVFAQLLETSTKENGQFKLSISDVSAKILKDLVSYIYSGTFDTKDPSHVRDLYAAADIYSFDELKAACSTFLKGLMTELQPVLDNFVLANTYNDEKLKEAAKKFLIENYFRIKSTEAWADFSQRHADLALPILLHLFDMERLDPKETS